MMQGPDERSTRPFLLFDLGGVLIENVGFERLAALLPAPLDIETSKARWLESTWVRDFELGRIDADAFAAGLTDAWKLRCSADAFKAEFASWPRGFFDGAIAFLAKLRATHRIGCLTNSNALHWARFSGFEDLFDVRLSSHLTGVIKPDRGCFEHAIAACGVAAERIRFFDDSKPNVVGAREAGMQAWHVEGFEALLVAVG